MPVTANDVIRFTMRSTYQGQEADNVFFYLIEAITTTQELVDVALDFYVAWTNVAKHIVLPAVSFYGVDALNLMDNGKAAYRPSTPVTGATTGNGTNPSFVAYGFGLIGATGITREGSKRLVGVPETWVEGNAWSGVSTTHMNAVLNFLKADPSLVVGPAMPVIVGRTPTGEYDMTRINPIVNAQLKSAPTTQNTRKAGKGI